MIATTYVLGMCLLAVQPSAGDESIAAVRPHSVELEEGQPLPAFESVSQDGNAWKSADHIGKSILVLYFYPGDFTGGCIKQAEAIRAGLVRLEEAGMEVVGISGDDVQTHRLFHKTYGLKHTLLADPEGKVASQLGVPVSKGARVRTRGPDGKPLMDGQGKSIILQRNVTLARWTLIVGREGKIVSKRTKVDPMKEAEEVLRIATEMEVAASRPKQSP
jgi:peroxiredoxin Q/BCP